MASSADVLLLNAFSNAATRVPAYGALLREVGIRVEDVQSLQDFQRLPVLGKQNTFQRFEIQELCLDGSLGRPSTVLTSSGHSGIFAYGLTDAAAVPAAIEWVDDALDAIFAVRSRTTLLINCLPMGVKLHTSACTVAETSVRPDMAIGLVKTFGPHFSQVIILGEAAFVKLVLEMGTRSGVDWKRHQVHLILGEEPLAENARSYFATILGHDFLRPEKGMIFSSMGVAELGLNIFFEVPPIVALVQLRRALHGDPAVRQEILGVTRWVPTFFTFDPQRVFVEFDASGRLIITTLNLHTRIPLIRYATGDQGGFVRFPPHVRGTLEAHGVPWEALQSIPIVSILGRGQHALAALTPVYPEAVKEGIYSDPALAALTTANFRLISDPSAVLIRIQLSPGVISTPHIEEGFRNAIARFVDAPYAVVCEGYEAFGSGMALDYERKFQYLGP